MKHINYFLLLATLTTSLANAKDYEIKEQGSITDLVYYQIGGGSVISPALTKKSPKSMTVGISWNSDLMCGNFDINTTVKNQLNGITEGFKDLMGNVINSATGAVASLPAMIIQRANPQLYDLLTNGVLQGRLDFNKAQLNCENMAEKMADYAYSSAWINGAKAENYQTIAVNEKDAVKANNQATKQAAEKGKRWIGGTRKGGVGQAPIKVISDTTLAGYNILNQRSVSSTATVSHNECQGEICRVWPNPADASKWITRVVGEQTINVASSNDKYGADENKTGTQAGIGLNPIIQEEQEKIITVLADLVNGVIPTTTDNLTKASGGNLRLTRGLIEALRDDPEASVLIQRLSSEMALSKVMEQTLIARRAILAGMREPNVANEKEAQGMLEKTVDSLDRELTQLKLEIDMRKSLSDNTAMLILERKTIRNMTLGKAIDINSDVDNKINQLNQTKAKE